MFKNNSNKLVEQFKKLTLIFLIIITALTNINTVKAEENWYYLGGFPLGFDLSGDGALIVGLSEVICSDDIYLPAKDAGIKPGDYLISLNGKKINFAKDVDEALNNYKENSFIIAEVLSEGKKCIKNIYPKKDLSGKYKLGVLIRDYISGLGTITLIDENGKFCSLGHPIIDEEGKILGIGGGFAYNCVINGIVKGERGKAGELKGTILRSSILGSVNENSHVGIIGCFQDKSKLENLKKMQVSTPQVGDAKVYTTLNGSKAKCYNISIVKVDKNEKNNKNMVIKITDEKIIRCAGGIVQGMSGSPIVQDGKIVGAITHVFLNDATRGYGISIEKMTEILKS